MDHFFPFLPPGEPLTPVIAGALTPAVNRSINNLKTRKVRLWEYYHYGINIP
jgi:hypothetical protein